jgi:polynucleotide 5'-kinase involved in rRNA processing
VKFVPTQIKAIVRGVEPMEVRLTEPGYVMEQYLTIQYDPSIPIAILDRINYQGNEYEVRAFLPQTEAETMIFGRARLRQLITPIPSAT